MFFFFLDNRGVWAMLLRLSKNVVEPMSDTPKNALVLLFWSICHAPFYF